METAIAFAKRELLKLKHLKGSFKLIGVQQYIVKSQYIWHVTFKPTELLPKDLSKRERGLGGEIFINVNLETKTKTITYGE